MCRTVHRLIGLPNQVQYQSHHTYWQYRSVFLSKNLDNRIHQRRVDLLNSNWLLPAQSTIQPNHHSGSHQEQHLDKAYCHHDPIPNSYKCLGMYNRVHSRQFLRSALSHVEMRFFYKKQVVIALDGH